MFIVKKKYFIKIITFLCAFIVVLACVFIQNSRYKDDYMYTQNNSIVSILNSITASIENINTSFEKGINLNNFSTESKSIYANTHNIKNMLFLTNEDFSNTVSWFSELNEYSKSDMTDSEKNMEYYNEIKEAHQVFINTCQEYKTTNSIKKIEEYFTPIKDAAYYNNILSNIENSFLILDTQIKSDRKDIGNIAKDILNSPITPKIFKGNFQLPAPLTYFTKNSYANIFREGNILCRLSIEDTSPPECNLYTSYSSLSQKYLEKYANYAPQVTEVYSYANNSLIYYVFCPFYIYNNIKVINYDEPIRLALSANDGSLKAFDSSQYLKKHSGKQNNINILNMSAIKTPELINNNKSTSYRYIIKNNNFYIEYNLSLENEVFYYLYSINSESWDIYNETEYFRRMEII